ncbi:MAG TPA: tetratricopeptide repeat protein, partial [Blastocatellia bacterium]|nr:tetratricopeptide repeat protein [Blastocatellia bacterium]
ARKVDRNYVDALTGQGELLNEKYQYADAAASFSDALKINPNSVEAHLGLAESRRNDSSTQAHLEVEQALKVNPNSVDALALNSELELEEERSALALRDANRALAVNPNSVEAFAVIAAIDYLSDDKTALDSTTKRALGVNPKAGQFYDVLSHFAVMNRRYQDAVDFERQALTLSPHLWSARTELGIELLRIGKETEGRAELEEAFKGDPFNLWAKNTLDLLDSMQDYEETTAGPFIIKSAPKDAGAVSEYAADLLDNAYKTLTAKYHFTPQGPLTVELFPNHEDFAVRSLGLPGLGALGVCFGKVIAMDSPSARQQGEFNWGSTLWHEFTHVITLQMTDHRIPRWFSEGLSVYEERHAQAGWGEKWNVDSIKAFNDGKFVKIDDLDAAFTRPQDPSQIPLAYFQASLVCDFVEQKFGFDSILRMLALYKSGAKTPAVLQQALGLAEDGFDRQFNDYVRSKVADYSAAVSKPGATAELKSKEQLVAYVASNPKDYFGHLRLGDAYQADGDGAHAAEQYKQAITLFPLYAANGNPYDKLADIYEKQGLKNEEAAILEQLIQVDDTPFDELKRLAKLKQAAGDRAAALDLLRQAFYVYPFDAGLHKLAGDMFLEQKDPAAAAIEYQVVVALRPSDAAQAHYDCANALAAAGKMAEARREVLKALEIAPEFPKAQELLLKLTGTN